MKSKSRMTKFDIAASVARIAEMSLRKVFHDRANLNIRKSLKVLNAERAIKLPPLKTLAVVKAMSRIETTTINVSKMLSPSRK